MFPKSPLTSKLGARVGRLAPEGFLPTDGDFAFVLGSDVAGDKRTLSVGDFFEISQITDLLTDDPTYLRGRFKFRPPAEMPGDTFWRFTLILEGNQRVLYELTGDNDRTVLRTDFAIPLRGVVVLTPGLRYHFAVRIELAGSAGDYDVELPGVYADSLLLDTLEVRPTLINRVPEPDETEVRVGSTVVVEISDPNLTAIGGAGGNISLTTTTIRVNGVLAYDGGAGGFQVGYTGPESAVDSSLDGTRTTRITIDPLVAFAPLVAIPVAISTQAKGTAAVQYDYTFTTQDLVAPTIVSASATQRRVVRAMLSESVLSSSAAATDDALNPANWDLTVVSTTLDDGLPAVTPVVLSVTEVGSDVYDLNLDIESTPGARYRLTVGPVADLFGNVFAAPNNSALFTGYVCAGAPGRVFELIDFLPDLNVQEDETDDLKKFVACLQEVTDVLLCDIDEWTDIIDPDVAPERFVDAMLADLGNPFDFDLEEVDKRRLIRVLVPIYEQKGTDPGIINAVRFFLGVEVTISVPAFDDIWLLGEGELGVDSLLGASDIMTRLGFYVVSPVVLTDDQKDKITKIVEYMKDARTHFLGFIEPTPPPPDPDHLELGLSELGLNWQLH